MRASTQIIFDADGTLRRTTVPSQPCPNTPEQWRLLPRVKQKLSGIDWDRGGYSLGIASNQGGVALGYLTLGGARQLLVDMVVRAIGYLPCRTYIELCTCPISAHCRCRKPAPGMLLRILRRSGVSADQTLFVGDAEEDLEAARRAGVDFRWAWEFFGWACCRLPHAAVGRRI
jgi:D-glycero-D-manno-heptose 1,7-bisphosphate phosphatase